MASFLEELWNSIFTPGATPTLLLATNATFAILQLILGLLLALTYSIHFVLLSFICAGLWWSVNWFAAELRKAEAAEKEAERLRRRTIEEKGPNSQLDEGDSDEADVDEDNDDETETETEAKVEIRGGPGKASAVMDSANTASSTATENAPKIKIRGGPNKILGVMKSAAEAKDKREAAAMASSQTSHKSLGEESGSVSTDSEWEKLSDRGV